MANVNKPTGLTAVRYLQGAPFTGGGNVYYIPPTDTNAYAIGDPVATLTGAADANGVSAVTLATGGSSNRIRGVIASCGGIGPDGAAYFDPTNLNTTVIPATKTKGYYVLVLDDPYIIFEVQELSGGSSTNFTAADIGKNVNLKSGANNGYVSGWTLDDTAASTTSANGQVQLLGIARRVDNAFGSYCKFYVRINQHEFNGALAGT